MLRKPPIVVAVLAVSLTAAELAGAAGRFADVDLNAVPIGIATACARL